MRDRRYVRNFRLLVIGLVTSMVGDSLMLLVFGIWVQSLTGSSSAAGLVIAVMATQAVIAALGGSVIDRFRRRPFLIWTYLLSTLIAAPLFAVHDRGDVWLIFVSAALYGLSMVVAGSTLNGLLQQLIPEAELARTNGMLQTVREGLRLLGPLAGAGLFALMGGAVVGAIDAMTFIVAAVAIWLIRLDEPRPERGGGKWLAEFVAGARFIGTDAGLRAVAFGGAVGWCAIGMIESVAYAIIAGLGKPPEFMGVISVAQGIGAILGGLGAAILIARYGELSVLAAGFAAFGIGVVGCVIRSLPVVLASKAVIGVGITLIAVGMSTIVQRRVPARLMGRTSTALELMHTVPQTSSITVGAILILVIDYRLVLLMMGMIAAGATLLLWSKRKLTERIPAESTAR
ncbi:MFS transporter [Nocardia arthritidis]|uniref:MFS transporter n=1 Tax=Nocardia arthritidis TaxID=228602 RepID=A0A6G9Y6V5_9NOCA|nr:MFS transporter [Nocardia arthritidis]QIS08864.1 MFS transporter [Nocardia arthritidis]